MSDTPRVDSVIAGSAIEPHHAPRLQDFARELERENAKLREELAKAKASAERGWKAYSSECNSPSICED